MSVITITAVPEPAAGTPVIAYVCSRAGATCMVSSPVAGPSKRRRAIARRSAAGHGLPSGRPSETSSPRSVEARPFATTTVRSSRTPITPSWSCSISARRRSRSLSSCPNEALRLPRIVSTAVARRPSSSGNRGLRPLPNSPSAIASAAALMRRTRIVISSDTKMPAIAPIRVAHAAATQMRLLTIEDA